MERIIGIDYGRKRVGVAVSDPLGIFASALETVPAAKIIDYLKNYTQNNKVERFVVGYPMNLNGKPAESNKAPLSATGESPRVSVKIQCGQRN